MALNQNGSEVPTDTKWSYDSEAQDAKGRKMSRLGTLTDDDEKLDIGRQIEMEADNAIKYRTCTWQKVIAIPQRFFSFHLRLSAQHL